MRVILASASPRRRDILNKHGIETIVMPSDVDETLPPELEDASPEKVVMYLALVKAEAIQNEVSAADGKRRDLTGNPGSTDELPRVIIAADTIVYKDGIIGKPTDADDAFRILSSLRGSSHGVYTGVAIIDMDKCVTVHESELVNLKTGRAFENVKMVYSESEGIFFDYDLTTVTFEDYPDAEIWRYIAEEPPYDKSGSYAVQSSWSANIAKVDGDVENVMGLPWHLIEAVLALLDDHQ
jgi:septum formation protein